MNWIDFSCVGKMTQFEVVFVGMLFLLMTCNCRYMFDRRTTEGPYDIYIDGNIYTVSPLDPDWNIYPEQAMVVNQNTGKIVYIGTNEIALEYYEEYSDVYNLEGGTVLPGFHDVHVHPLEANTKFNNEKCMTLPRDTEPEILLDQMSKCDPKDGGKSWVLGHGHSIGSLLSHIDKGGRPPREILDEAFPHNPVVIMEETSHSFWVNSLALDRADISKESEDPVGGIIMRDPKTGVPNGILLENAGNMIMDIAMASFNNLQEENYNALIASLIELRENGITSICDARTYWKRFHHLAWKKACDNDKLTVRANLGLWAYPNMGDSEQMKSLEELYDADYSNKCFLRINEIKLYADGLLETTTAAMLEPYIKNMSLPGLEANIGMNYFTRSRVEKYLTALQSKGFNFHIHAIGDRGVQEMLDAIEKTWEEGTRHRMTHLHIVNEHDMPRFHRLGVVADFQVTNTYIPDIKEVVGRKRTENYIPVRSLEETGAVVTMSSDFDVSRLNPLEAIQEAASRGGQSVSVKSAIEMKTVNSAYAMRQGKMVGYLAPNMDADFVILDKDILDINIDEIGGTEILVTALQGRLIHKKYEGYPTSKY